MINYYLALGARKPVFGFCEKQRRRPAWVHVLVQPDQHLFTRLLESILSRIATGVVSNF